MAKILRDEAMRLSASPLVLVVTALAVTSSASTPTTEIPFEFRDGLLWVAVKVPQNPKPLHFLLDSGANVSVINLRTARELGLRLGQRVEVRGVGAITEGYWPERLAAKVGDVRLARDYLAMDLEGLGRVCNRPIDGLIGADFFREHVVQIDFTTQKVRLLNRGWRPAGGELLPLETRRCGLRIAIGVNGGKPQWVRLDTGCATPLQWVASDVDSKSCTAQMAVALTKLSIPTAKVQVQIGSIRFDSVPAGVHEREIFAGESGLLGNGLLSRFDLVTIDTKAGWLVLEKAPQNRPPTP